MYDMLNQTLNDYYAWIGNEYDLVDLNNLLSQNETLFIGGLSMTNYNNAAAII